MNIITRSFLCVAAALIFNGNSYAAPIYADTVNSFTGGTGFGVFDQSGGTYTGATGAGVFDALAVTDLDGAILGLGIGTPAGEIIMSFSTGSVIDGAGADLRFYDTFGLSEGFILEISADGSTYFGIGTFAGDFSLCSPGSPCITDVDIAGAAISSASFLKITADLSTSVGGFPGGYDLDAVEALNFSAANVPEPTTLVLMSIGLFGLGIIRRKRIQELMCTQKIQKIRGVRSDASAFKPRSKL